MSGINNYHLNEEGLQRFFGSLQARIMETIWASDQLSIKEVHARLNDESPIALNTVMTVMNRLEERGILRKSTTGRGKNRLTLYSAVQSKEQFLAEQAKTVTHGLIREFGDLVVAHMVDAMEEADPALIQKLERKLMELKQRS
ncbi:BlaI/MecI/CopY family transcriptional regulator [Paenibacillus humicola]|uniref:BlaI/MecI/CopY family transcriptional regulator n=1 Tax=Paenibacillus humicola TaxID=3110540 RepID=UPI00237C10FB|nr:BlaI/MecI/CopY family transcriptional regulator [Paenibacillus humicola]